MYASAFQPINVAFQKCMRSDVSRTATTRPWTFTLKLAALESLQKILGISLATKSDVAMSKLTSLWFILSDYKVTVLCVFLFLTLLFQGTLFGLSWQHIGEYCQDESVDGRPHANPDIAGRFVSPYEVEYLLNSIIFSAAYVAYAGYVAVRGRLEHGTNHGGMTAHSIQIR
ncbi:hypothetical protein EK21DRAFT_91032 [Setomelanomma holmii]|uniref:Uncharacterized protein n=1 Tax=Setomelanomma holmii TaxID=210430 RepID=A0A9P4H6D5_9PLEO|nr:hypothetical protein EK21DRAFT_91032 [Setomelanomma holmii]